uniref:Ionotropic glutamate receptor L-glutamate and glycine-binding domain-containing protein n=1 Tax=Megaselia scalaris TaxID=36166 RepID=T1GVU4_MEGSC
MYREGLRGEVLEGNAKYEGYCVDLIRKLAKISNFEFTFVEADSNGKYMKEKREWDGIIGYIIDRVVLSNFGAEITQDNLFKSGYNSLNNTINPSDNNHHRIPRTTKKLILIKHRSAFHHFGVSRATGNFDCEATGYFLKARSEAEPMQLKRLRHMKW